MQAKLERLRAVVTEITAENLELKTRSRSGQGARGGGGDEAQGIAGGAGQTQQR
jgi:hypothetical protein